MALNKIIHIWVLTIYLITSSLVIGVNKWSVEKDADNEDFSEWLISSMTISLSDNPDDSAEIPFLFKDPSEDGSIVLNNYPRFIALEFASIDYIFQMEEKIKDPFLNIFSPPPQLI